MGVDGNKVTVLFVQNSACSGCHAKALCSGGSSESAEKKVVANSYGVPYQIGDKVKVIVAGGLAWSAVVIAFVVPLILVFITLFTVVKVTGNEVVGCLGTLAMLAVYYFFVWTMRDSLERKVEFTLEHLVG